MAITQVKLRNGELADFDSGKIEHAITLACDATGTVEKEFIPKMTEDIVAELTAVCCEGLEKIIPSVETIQDIVEKHLMKDGKFEIAKAYILYRGKQAQKRDEKKEKIVEQFEKNSLKVTKSNGKKELFDAAKIKAVFERSAAGYEEFCKFEDLMEAFKKNIVDEIKTWTSTSS